MKIWATEIRAIDPADGKLKTWPGVNVPGDTRAEARLYCINNGLEYLRVVGEVIDVEHFTELYDLFLN